MKIFPRDIFQIETSMTTSEIISTLEANVEPRKWLRWPFSDTKRFEGEYSRDGFKIMRIISYRNSFLPIIEATIRPTAFGNRIAVLMRLHRFVALFMAIWFGGIGTGLVISLLASTKGRSDSFPFVLFPMGMMIVFGIVLVSGSFWWEVKKTKPIIIDMFKGKIVNNPIPIDRL